MKGNWEPYEGGGWGVGWEKFTFFSSCFLFWCLKIILVWCVCKVIHLCWVLNTGLKSFLCIYTSPIIHSYLFTWILQLKLMKMPIGLCPRYCGLFHVLCNYNSLLCQYTYFRIKFILLFLFFLIYFRMCICWSCLVEFHVFILLSIYEEQCTKFISVSYILFCLPQNKTLWFIINVLLLHTTGKQPHSVWSCSARVSVNILAGNIYTNSYVLG